MFTVALCFGANDSVEWSLGFCAIYNFGGTNRNNIHDGKSCSAQYPAPEVGPVSSESRQLRFLMEHFKRQHLALYLTNA